MIIDGKKNVCFVSIFSRVFLDRRNIRSLESIYSIKYLESNYNCKIDIVTSKIKELKDLNNVIDLSNNIDIFKYDSLIIHLSPFNLFGGYVSKNISDTLRLILSFSGSIELLYTDPKILYYNYLKILKDRYFINKNITFEDESFVELLTDENINNFENKNYSYLFSGNNFELFKDELHNDKILWPTSGIYIPLFEFIFMNELKHKKVEFDLSNKEFDLVYYGNNRGGYRNKVLKKLFTSKFKKYLIGYEDKFDNCTFEKYVHTDQLPLELNKCFASITIGDKAHENNFVTARFFENILNGLINFIYLPYDQSKRLYENEILKDILYVNNDEEIETVLSHIKEDKKLHKYILDLQMKELLKYKELVL